MANSNRESIKRHQRTGKLQFGELRSFKLTGYQLDDERTLSLFLEDSKGALSNIQLHSTGEIAVFGFGSCLPMDADALYLDAPNDVVLRVAGENQQREIMEALDLYIKGQARWLLFAADELRGNWIVGFGALKTFAWHPQCNPEEQYSSKQELL